MSKTFDYQGFHATADVLLKSYPEDMVSIVRDSIKYSKLNVVGEKIHDFGGAVTALFVLSESHFSMSIFNNVKNIIKNTYKIINNDKFWWNLLTLFNIIIFSNW